MSRQNRVTSFGEIVAHPARGLAMGNRGILHDGAQRLGRARWRHKAWICCVLSFKGRRRQIMAPGRYTELFFADEAVAMAAGHRPCAECRRAAYLAFQAAFAAAHPATGPRPGAKAMDDALHKARTGPAPKPVPRAAIPEGGFAEDGQGGACLFWAGRWWRWAADSYAPAGDLPQILRPLTPAPLLAVLAAGYRPEIMPASLEIR